MKIFKLIVKLIYSLITLAACGAFAYIFVLYVAPGTLPGPQIEMLHLLIAIGVLVLFSLPTVISLMRFIARVTGQGLLAFGALLIWLLIAPAGLLIASIVGIIASIVGFCKCSGDGVDLDTQSTLASDEIYRASKDRAARRLIDGAYNGDITIDDGESFTTYHKVALIDFMDDKYALISPATTADGVAEAYRIYIAEDGLYDLERVTDRLAYTIIYDRYRRLINN